MEYHRSTVEDAVYTRQHVEKEEVDEIKTKISMAVLADYKSDDLFYWLTASWSIPVLQVQVFSSMYKM